MRFENIFISLTKWEVFEYKNNRINSYIYPNIDSQDSWIFLTPMRDNYTNIPLIYLGEQGCDQVITYYGDLMGYDVLNPCYDIKSFHFHLSNIVYLYTFFFLFCVIILLEKL